MTKSLKFRVQTEFSSVVGGPYLYSEASHL